MAERRKARSRLREISNLFITHASELGAGAREKAEAETPPAPSATRVEPAAEGDDAPPPRAFHVALANFGPPEDSPRAANALVGRLAATSERVTLIAQPPPVELRGDWAERFDLGDEADFSTDRSPVRARETLDGVLLVLTERLFSPAGRDESESDEAERASERRTAQRAVVHLLERPGAGSVDPRGWCDAVVLAIPPRVEAFIAAYRWLKGAAPGALGGVELYWMMSDRSDETGASDEAAIGRIWSEIGARMLGASMHGLGRIGAGTDREELRPWPKGSRAETFVNRADAAPRRLLVDAWVRRWERRARRSATNGAHSKV
jgi:hypothetical protein